MASDCTVKIDGGYINIRVGAIIMKNGLLLMARAPKERDMGYYYTVGGRIRFGETAEEAVIREVYEETGAWLEIDRLGFVHEALFIGDGAKAGKLIYETAYFFYMKVPDGFEPRGGGVEETLHWIDPFGKEKYYPEFFRSELKDPCAHVKHIVTDERRDGIQA